MASRKRQFDESSIADTAERKRAATPQPPSRIGFDGGSDLVCFGMIIDVTGSAPLPPDTLDLPVRLDAADCFVSLPDAEPSFRGTVDSGLTFLTSALLAAEGLELEITASCVNDQITNNRGKRGISVQCPSRPCRLNIIIYGPSDLSDEIGGAFQECDIYLQDPIGCSRDVRYCNPHRLPPAGPSAPVFTSSLTAPAAAPGGMWDLVARPQLLDILDTQDDLAEAPQPPSIRTPLAKHQKQALTFMLGRERGWAWDGSRPDIWELEERNDGREQRFINSISDQAQKEVPPQFYGGIIADPMGLGKTLSMISLIATDITKDDHFSGASLGFGNGGLPEKCSERTLVVVPPPLLGTWQEQLTEHVFPNSLPWCLHHGKSRLSSAAQIQDTMIVITTYHTVAAERKAGSSSVLFMTRWKRIILDEAHYIRNGGSQMARAICTLDSVARWAVTGTPIQNRLEDLATLLKFLQAYPYSDRHAFDTDIANLWKSGRDEEAVQRLKRLAGCLLLRRRKEIVELPPKHDLKCPVSLSAPERQLYDGIRTQALAKIDEALAHHGARSHSFVNVLQRIEAMRMVCNLGLSYHARHEIENSSSQHQKSAADNWGAIAQRTFNIRRGMGHLHCEACEATLDITVGDSTPEQSWSSSFTRCLQYTCSACVKRLGRDTVTCTCGQKTPCPVASVSTDTANLDDAPAVIPLDSGAFEVQLSSKVTMLLEDLQRQPADIKCVVFSTWRMTLDLVEAGLSKAGVHCLRFDGKVPQKERQGVVDRFRNDPSVRVLLLTLSCGAVGLTLTAASRAYLMEPHWNPTLEDQALARIHRMGQTREVTTVRFVVKNSFEERVIEIQDSKRGLAAILLNHQGEGGTSNRNEPLERLRRLI